MTSSSFAWSFWSDQCFKFSLQPLYSFMVFSIILNNTHDYRTVPCLYNMDSHLLYFMLVEMRKKVNNQSSKVCLMIAASSNMLYDQCGIGDHPEVRPDHWVKRSVSLGENGCFA